VQVLDLGDAHGLPRTSAAKSLQVQPGRTAHPSAAVPEQDQSSWLHLCSGSAQRNLYDRKKNGTANHAKHANGGSGLQDRDDVFD
jgi:hypothetical protein